MLDYALKYADIGWYVIPLFWVDHGKCSCGEDCPSPGKHPLISGGLRNASKEESVIRDWWGKWPKANIGICTGSESGIWVLDVDYKSGGIGSLGTLIEENGSLGEPLCVYTGGGGRHYYYDLPESTVIRSRSGVVPGLDVRGHGGYVVAPPSGHLSGTYSWDQMTPFDAVETRPAPAWVIAMVEGEQDACESAQVPHGSVNGLSLMSEVETAELADALQHIDNLERAIWLKVGMAINFIDNTQSGFSCWAWWSKLGEGIKKFNETDQLRVWKSFRRRGVAPASIFYLAQEAGWVNPMAEGDDCSVEAAPVDVKLAPAPVRAESTRVISVNAPGVLGRIASYILDTAPRPNRMFALNAAICLAGTVMGQIVCSETGLRTNMYLLSIGQSGAGKDHPRKAVTKILDEANLFQLIGGEDFSSGSSIMSMLASSNVRLSQLDEFGKLLAEAIGSSNNVKQTIMRRLMTLFSSADTVVAGNEVSNLTKKRVDIVKRKDIRFPHLSLHLTTVLNELVPALSSADVLSGFLNRMLITVSEDSPAKLSLIQKKKEVPAEIIDWIHTVRRPNVGTTNLEGAISENPRVLSMGVKAYSILDQFNDHVHELSNQMLLRGQGLELLYGRTVEHAIKLSLIAAVAIDPETRAVQPEAITWACEYVLACTQQAVDLCAYKISDSPFHAKVKEVYEIIWKSGVEGIGVRELKRVAPLASLKPREKSEVLDAVSHFGVMRKVVTTGGRPSTVLIAADPAEN